MTIKMSINCVEYFTHVHQLCAIGEAMINIELNINLSKKVLHIGFDRL